jgi:uncharacterized membrane protein YoaK (UPF0700 family)
MPRNRPETPGPDDQPAGLALVFLLAAFAGTVDACGLSILKDLYVSFMSGNTTSLARALAQQDWPRAGLLGEIIGGFVAGAAGGEALALLAGRYRLPVVILAVAAILTVPPLARAAAVPAMVFAMGALNAAMLKAGPVPVSVTYATGALVKFGQGLSRWIFGQARDATWLQQTVPWLGLLAGASVAALTIFRVGTRTYAALPLVALAMAVASYAAVPDAESASSPNPE